MASKNTSSKTQKSTKGKEPIDSIQEHSGHESSDTETTKKSTTLVMHTRKKRDSSGKSRVIERTLVERPIVKPKKSPAKDSKTFYSKTVKKSNSESDDNGKHHKSEIQSTKGHEAESDEDEIAETDGDDENGVETEECKDNYDEEDGGEDDEENVNDADGETSATDVSNEDEKSCDEVCIYDDVSTRKKIVADNPVFNWSFKYFVVDVGSLETLKSKMESMGDFYVDERICKDGDRPYFRGYMRFATRKRFTQLMNIDRLLVWEKCSTKDIKQLRLSRKEHDMKKTNVVIWEDVEVLTSLNSWQKKLVHILLEKPDSKITYWYFKSKVMHDAMVFGKYMAEKHQAVCMAANVDEFSQIAFANPSRIYIFFYDETCRKDNTFFAEIRRIKYGLFRDKSGAVVQRNSTHVLVFSDEEPPIQDKLYGNFEITVIKDE